jgi:site-specific DNA-methyltransferase (adenine-specific)
MNDIFNDNVPLKTETPAFAKHVLPAVPLSEVYLEDCVTALKRYADNHFDLAIVDPPYGLNVITGRSFGDPLRKDGTIRHGIDKRNGAKIVRKASTYTKKDWDKAPPNEEYFKELMRVSKNQIVWGANHFISRMPYDSSAWIVWDKVNGSNDFADCEMAWTSFKKATRLFAFMWNGMLQGSSADGRIMEGNVSKREKRLHPTQKPVKLYDWILKNYANEGDLILDTHLGSGSSRIAAYKGGFNFVGFEIDQEYYEKQEKRFNDFKSQLRLF